MLGDGVGGTIFDAVRDGVGTVPDPVRPSVGEVLMLRTNVPPVDETDGVPLFV